MSKSPCSLSTLSPFSAKAARTRIWGAVDEAALHVRQIRRLAVLCSSARAQCNTTTPLRKHTIDDGMKRQVSICKAGGGALMPG